MPRRVSGRTAAPGRDPDRQPSLLQSVGQAPQRLSAFEGELRERLRRDFDRGHLSVQARWTESADGETGFTVDLDRARLVAARLREMQPPLGSAAK